MPRLHTTADHKWIIPMPWKQMGWSISNDIICRGRKIFVIGWYTKFGSFFLRMGWGFRPDVLDLQRRTT